jgi:hypothetical protein
MKRRDKVITDKEEFLSLIPLIKTFPVIHNKLKDDFQNLLDITMKYSDNKFEFQTLGRLCIKNLFSMIEADLHYYNLFDKYNDYDDKDRFIEKFKKTFKQIAKTWEAETFQTEYFNTKLQKLKALKGLRNSLMHPKSLDDFINPTQNDVKEVEAAFKAYNIFISNIMTDFFFSYEGIDKQEVYEQVLYLGTLT